MDISWLNKKIAHADSSIKQKLKNLTDMLNGTVKTVRRISSELRPSLLDDLGLVAAMEWQLKEFEDRSGITTTFAADETEVELPNSVKTGIFRIFQESLTNIARHADAKNVSTSLKNSDQKIVLCIEDDGKGFDKKKIEDKRTLGILGMKERTLMMGGEYSINSIPGKGTTVLVVIAANK
jgi:signal transduction histidine kinase